MTGWGKFIFDVHSWVVLLFSWSSGYLIGTKIDDNVPKWLLTIITIFFIVVLPFLLIMSIPTKV